MTRRQPRAFSGLFLQLPKVVDYGCCRSPALFHACPTGERDNLVILDSSTQSSKGRVPVGRVQFALHSAGVNGVALNFGYTSA